MTTRRSFLGSISAALMVLAGFKPSPKWDSVNEPRTRVSHMVMPRGRFEISSHPLSDQLTIWDSVNGESICTFAYTTPFKPDVLVQAKKDLDRYFG